MKQQSKLTRDDLSRIPKPKPWARILERGKYALMLLIAVLIVTNATEVKAAVPEAAKAISGTGIFRDKIFWLNWDLNGNATNGKSSLMVPANNPSSNTGCVTGCNDNTFLNSEDPNTIEYDDIISGFHASMSFDEPTGAEVIVSYFEEGEDGYGDSCASEVLFHEDFGISDLKLFSLEGKLIGNSNTNEMDLSRYSSGNYLLEVRFDDNNTIVKKILKQ